MTNEIRNQDLGMEPTGKIVEYCAYAWKLALPSIGKIISDDDDDGDDDGDEDDGYDEDLERKSRNEGYIITVLPFGTEQQSYEKNLGLQDSEDIHTQFQWARKYFRYGV